MNLLRVPSKSALRIFGVVFAAIFLVAIIYVVRRPRVYEATAKVQFYPEIPTQTVWSGPLEEPLPMIEATVAAQLLAKVEDRLTDAERTLLLAPYELDQIAADGEVVTRLIRKGLVIDFETPILRIRYRHPERLAAARIANLYADEVIAYHVRLRIDESMKQVDALVLRAKSQQGLVQDLADELSAYREMRKKSTTESIENDELYQVLLKSQVDAQKTLDELIPRIRDTTMICGPTPISWGVTQRAVPPNQPDYLIEPIVVHLLWGFAVAVIGGLLAVGAVNSFTRSRERTDDQEETA